MRRSSPEVMMSQNELDEALEVALVDLVDGVEIDSALRARLADALGGEVALSEAIAEARQGIALTRRLAQEAPSERLIEGVLSPARRRRRARAQPSGRVYVELWVLGFLIVTLLIAWLSFHAHQRALTLRLGGELRPIPHAGAEAPE